MKGRPKGLGNENRLMIRLVLLPITSRLDILYMSERGLSLVQLSVE